MKPITETQIPLFHGMRSKKTAKQIKEEGFCSYGSPVDEKKAIVDALKHFGKEKILHKKGTTKDMISNQLQIMSNTKFGKLPGNRLSTYATTIPEASCNWWARANPEHISLILGHAGVSEKDTAKYLDEKYGKNCYRVELNLNLDETQKRRLYENKANFNTNKICIKPSEIKDVKKCKSCNYTYNSVEDNI